MGGSQLLTERFKVSRHPAQWPGTGTLLQEAVKVIRRHHSDRVTTDERKLRPLKLGLPTVLQEFTQDIMFLRDFPCGTFRSMRTIFDSRYLFGWLKLKPLTVTMDPHILSHLAAFEAVTLRKEIAVSLKKQH